MLRPLGGADAAQRYYMLTASEHWGPEIEQLCTIILKATIKDADKYQIGLTKIFFRAGMLAYLERLRTERLNYLVTLMQKNLLRAVQQKKFQRIRSTTIALQATWRRILAQRRLHAVKREAAAVTLQSAFRSHVQRSKYLKTRNAAITIQSSQSPSFGVFEPANNCHSAEGQCSSTRAEGAEAAGFCYRIAKAFPRMASLSTSAFG